MSVSNIDLNKPSHLLAMIEAIENLLPTDSKRFSLAIDIHTSKIKQLLIETNISHIEVEHCIDQEPEIRKYQVAPGIAQLKDRLQQYFENNFEQIKKFLVFLKLKYTFATENFNLFKSLLHEYPFLLHTNDIKFLSLNNRLVSEVNLLRGYNNREQFYTGKDDYYNIHSLIELYEFSSHIVRRQFSYQLNTCLNDTVSSDNDNMANAYLGFSEVFPHEDEPDFMLAGQDICLHFSYGMNPIQPPKHLHPLRMLGSALSQGVMEDPCAAISNLGVIGFSIGVGLLICQDLYCVIKKCFRRQQST